MKPNLKTIYILLLFLGLIFVSYADHKVKIIATFDIVRHGDRTPTGKIKKLGWCWKEDPGELTCKGYRQGEQTGEQLAKNMEKEGILEKNFYTRTTNYNRTRQTLQALLSKIHSHRAIATEVCVDDKVHDMLVPPDRKSDQKLQELVAKYVYTSIKWQDKYNELTLNGDLDKWEKLTGEQIITDKPSQWDSLQNLRSLGGKLAIYSKYNCNLDQIDEKSLKDIITQYKELYPQAYAPRQIGGYIAYNFLDYIFTELSSNPSAHQINIFLSHDEMIFGILSALDSPLNEPVPYAADLRFSFLNNKKIHIQLFDGPNGKEFAGFKINVPECHNSNICSLIQFKQLLKTLRESAKKDDISLPLNKQCTMKHEYLMNKKKGFTDCNTSHN